MKKITFLCTLSSDVVIHADSNTEGNIPLHDYIPGSNFLGIVAKEYESFGEKSFDIFHGGKVRFGDAHPLVNDRYALRPPLCWFHKKGAKVEDGLYNQLHMNDDELRELVRRGIQLKQLRTGFFAEEGYMSISHKYSQKSAYDSEKRRSMEGAMYGYSALPRGLKMLFDLSYDETAIDDETIERVCRLLEGERGVGKSRSAQYGTVQIERHEKDIAETAQNPSGNEEIVLYAKSRLALIDRNGNTTPIPSSSSLSLPEGARIDWGRSQIRTAVFAPYNAARRTRDYQRFIIDKGSVVVITNLSTDFDAKAWLERNGGAIGGYRSEGFGEVLIDPVFLSAKNISLESVAPAMAQKGRYGEEEALSTLSSWIKRQRKKKTEELKLIEAVKSFIDANGDRYRSTTPSQWGALRAFARTGYDKKSVEEYLNKGKASKEQWSESRKKLLFDAIDKVDDKASFLRLLAAEMAKHIGSEGDRA